VLLYRYLIVYNDVATNLAMSLLGVLCSKAFFISSISNKVTAGIKRGDAPYFLMAKKSLIIFRQRSLSFYLVPIELGGFIFL